MAATGISAQPNLLTAILHLRYLSLFASITRIPSDPLNHLARHVFSSLKPSSKSWFWIIRDLCVLYQFPHPLQLLDTPLSKEKFKKLAKSKVIDLWETKLRGEATLLPSLKHFKPEYMSLTRPHPLWTTTKSNPYEVSKAVQQARFLSGRYRTESLCKHWSKNTHGYCLSETCISEEETIEHILLFCPAYTHTRYQLQTYWFSRSRGPIFELIIEALTGPRNQLLQFLLDCSNLPSVITATQLHGSVILEELFHLTRTWCFAHHRDRMKLLGRWNFT